MAELAIRNNDTDRAIELYKKAAELENLALKELDSSRTRTIGISTVSAASLWFKAKELHQAQLIAHQGLATSSLPTFAVEQLQELLQVIWSEEARSRAGINFSEGEVLVSVSGGEVVRGGAPLELIIQKVDEVGRIFYRIIEMLLDLPLRRRGAPNQEIQDQFRPWLFQAPQGSYQFTVRVEKPRQLSLFPEYTPGIDLITQRFMDIMRASSDDPEGELTKIVPNEDYRNTFMKLTRNLAPTGKVFGRLEIRSPSDLGSHPVVLMPASREIISHAIRISEKARHKPDDQQEIQIQGILRGLQLDNDWLEVNTFGDAPKTIHIFETGDVIDDVVGPLVNRRVIVNAILKPNGHYAYRDIQPDE